MDEQFSFTVRARLPLRLRIPWQVSASSGRQRCLDLKLIMLVDHLLPTTSILGDSAKARVPASLHTSSGNNINIFSALSRSKRTPLSLGVDHHGLLRVSVLALRPASTSSPILANALFFSESASGNLTSVECQNLLTTIYRISSFMLLQMFIGFLNSLYGDDAVTIPP